MTYLILDAHRTELMRGFSPVLAWQSFFADYGLDYPTDGLIVEKEILDPEKNLFEDGDGRFIEDILGRAVSNIQAGTRMNPQYNPDQDIKYAIDDIIQKYGEGPDILLTVSGNDVHVYSDDPSRLGTVLLWHQTTKSEPSPITLKMEPLHIDGYAETWQSELASVAHNNTSFDYTAFLERFLERNLLDSNEDII